MSSAGRSLQQLLCKSDIAVFMTLLAPPLLPYTQLLVDGLTLVPLSERQPAISVSDGACLISDSLYIDSQDY